ncbi:AraC family transcriptional regulator [Shouchella lonarensis]|uniref:AraC family transcriptional regulator n=1 Tax=Shouchella lonarensis TaxID=1464122 RepID=A0A1G6GTS0_9BACI|nr:AraC family transcriptional regulator [Shouchella lonarensis]
MNYRIEEKDAFKVVGLKKRVKLVSTGENSEIVEVLEAISDETYAELEALSNMAPAGILNVCANFSEEGSGAGELDFYVAATTTKQAPAHFETLKIDVSSWAVFSIEGDWEDVQALWGRIYSEWFPTSGYEHAGGPEILGGTEEQSEIWIPVVKK